MFDPVTSELIQSAFPLEGLDLSQLPKKLTEAFAEIVTARVVMRTNANELSLVDLQETVSQMRRLASAQEAYVAISPNSSNRAAAAFVAAAAHQVCMTARIRSARFDSYLKGAAISPDVCASLLFLIADAHPDATETAKLISIPEDASRGVEVALLSCIKELCLGNLGGARAATVALVDESRPDADRAVDLLYIELHKGIHALVDRILSPPWAFERSDDRVNDSFKKVRELSTFSIDSHSGNVISTFAGPLHLARLLISAEEGLLASSITRVFPPDGVERSNWLRIIRRIARKRPFLWRNHREGVASGYLKPGNSAAISFPTGGGKSTLSELKIAATLLRDRKVVFLVPTHALVDQTAASLKSSFSTFSVVGDIEDDLTLDDVVVLPQVVVTTPERCLVLMMSDPGAFRELGLIVFDECHLLHPREAELSRRSVDSMLALLNLTLLAPEADLLLISAMMKNSNEISSWIEEMTGRYCLSLNLPWKPTRQVRGSVVYQARELKQLRNKLRRAEIDHPDKKHPPAAVVRELVAQPFAFFCLLQTWATQSRADYALLPLVAGAHGLATGGPNGKWYLTPNGGETSAQIAAAAVAGGLKTLIFAQTIPYVESAKQPFSLCTPSREIALTENELSLHKLASEELGGSGYCYLSVNANGRTNSVATSHHSLLLREERLLHESLFKRKGGIDALFATSTLAQGMNLPADMVIIWGDQRFDATQDRIAQLEAHELLNAAGRAGRAGESAQGIVLVVPSRVVEFDEENSLIGRHWMELQSIFSQSDQCLAIDDPLAALMDAIHEHANAGGLSDYMLSKMPFDEGTAGSAINTILGRSLCAYRARRDGADQWLASRIASVVEARQKIAGEVQESWLNRVAASTGVSPRTLESLSLAYEGVDDALSLPVAIEKLFDWLNRNPERFFEVLRPSSIGALFGQSFAIPPISKEKADFAVPILLRMLNLWLTGKPLIDIERAFGGNPDEIRCKKGRNFLLKVVPDLAFLAELPARIEGAKRAALQIEKPLPVLLAAFGSLVREGCDSLECLATRFLLGKTISRVSAHARFQGIESVLGSPSESETFDEIKARVWLALRMRHVG